MGGRERSPAALRWPSVTHRLNEPGMLPPDALWPRLRDAGRTVISHSSASLTQYGTGCRDENLPLLHSIVDQQRDGRLSLENPHIYLPAWTVYRRERDSEQMKEYRKLSNLYCLLYLTCDASTVRQNCGDGMYHRLWVGLFITGTASMLVLIWQSVSHVSLSADCRWMDCHDI